MKVIEYYNSMKKSNITHTAHYFGLKRDNIKNGYGIKNILYNK